MTHEMSDAGMGGDYGTPAPEDESITGGSEPAGDPGAEGFDVPLAGDGTTDESGNPDDGAVAGGRTIRDDDGDPPAATSSSLEQADGANDDLEPRGEQGGPDDAA